MAFLTSELESRSLELQTMPGLVSKAMNLRKEMSNARKEADDQYARLVSLSHVVDEVSKIKKNLTNLSSSSSQAEEHCISQEPLTRQQEIEMGVL